MGIAKLIETSQNSLMGCRKYMPIEFYTGTYDQKLDVFTFGLTINELYNGSHTKNPPITLVKKSNYFLPIIMKCINLHPVNRPTSSSINLFFIKFQKLINKNILKQTPNYIQMSYTFRNDVFKEIYAKLADQVQIE
jgi:serine/threonine protein kinase